MNYTPGTICWVAPNFERGLLVASDPRADSFLVAYCEADKRASGGGVYPTPADFKVKQSSYTRVYKKAGGALTTSSSAPSYFHVEWVSTSLVTFDPPAEGSRKRAVEHLYESMDSILRGFPKMSDDYWYMQAVLYVETKDMSGWATLPDRYRKMLQLAWRYEHDSWVAPIVPGGESIYVTQNADTLQWHHQTDKHPRCRVGFRLALDALMAGEAVYGIPF